MCQQGVLRVCEGHAEVCVICQGVRYGCVICIDVPEGGVMGTKGV